VYSRSPPAQHLSALPKRWYAVSDDQARNWFEKKPHLGLAIAKENFPNSIKPFP